MVVANLKISAFSQVVRCCHLQCFFNKPFNVSLKLRNMAVVIETTIGDFTVDLYTDERPQTCRNFLKLCKIKYYNWNLFHTVQSNFIAQTGDPTGTGKGGESVYGIVLGEKAKYYEMEQMPKIKHSKSGLLSMVNCGNNMLGSQFFITLAPELQSLDGEHCIFGEIVEGMEVILKFNEAICDGDQRPYQDIRISHTVILEDPFDDPIGLPIPDKSPEPTKEALMSDRIGADEEIDDTAGMTAEEIIEMQKEKEAKARATILEIVGDIPDAEMAPPENVLFVCKLNPVTNDDDLEIIFSRFGKIVGCEVIRDRQSGDSLQYAFIEFADRKSCEEAYFKMDNVLIDDRRIHVDFSQSVARMRWRGKGKGIKYYDEEKDPGKENEQKRKRSPNGRKERSSKDDKYERKRFDEERKKKTYNEKSYENDAQSHRQYEKQKERRDIADYSRNGDKYFAEKHRKESRRREGSHEPDRQRNRSKDRSKTRHDRDYDRENQRERKRSDKYYSDSKRSNNYDSEGEDGNVKRHHKRHSAHKKHRDRDRSEESKHKRKRK